MHKKISKFLILIIHWTKFLWNITLFSHFHDKHINFFFFTLKAKYNEKQLTSRNDNRYNESIPLFISSNRPCKRFKQTLVYRF